MLENNEITRKYHASVEGKIKSKGVFENPIGKDRHIKNKMIVYKNGQYAKTNYTRTGCCNNTVANLASCFNRMGC